jgi:hypothetical protein
VALLLIVGVIAFFIMRSRSRQKNGANDVQLRQTSTGVGEYGSIAGVMPAQSSNDYDDVGDVRQNA